MYYYVHIFVSMKGNNIRDYRHVNTLDSAAMAVQDYADLKNYRSTSTIYNIARKVIDGEKSWEQVGFEIVRFKGFNYVIPLTK